MRINLTVIRCLWFMATEYYSDRSWLISCKMSYNLPSPGERTN